MEKIVADKATKGKNKRGKGWLFALLIVILLIGGAYLFRKPLLVLLFDRFISPTLESKLQQSYQPRRGGGGNMSVPKPVLHEDKPFSVLLLGADQRPYEKTRGRSDTIIYAVVRPKEARVLLVSVPRDMYVQIVGRDANDDGVDDYDKITHAYAYGGEEMSIHTIENFLKHPVNYYAVINFQGLLDVVTAVGGVPLPIEHNLENTNPKHELFKLQGGKPLYNGEEVLHYLRYREDSDFSRTKRNQIFLKSLMDRVLTFNGVTKVPELLDIMGQNFRTDMLPGFMTGLGKQVLLQGNPQISNFTIMGGGFKMNGIYYDKVYEKDLNYAQGLIENWMDSNTTSATLKLPNR